ncbi:MAG: 2,3,4,5-tetrahydropyridine-2,6-dicarboxylate N-acetyltransferase, partial [Ignavibacteria bacterium]|nr:2,3,4,5-tetrahydropyridine-2,6-dicarboxylate N-acetyltransferase [Ignavibacteria bacterium]
MDSYEIINYIASSKKKTPAKIYLQGKLGKVNFKSLEFFGGNKSGVLFCELEEFDKFYKTNKDSIKKYRIEIDRRNSAIPLADLTKYNARIEPGALIREHVAVGDNCVIMMGAVLNIGAVIGEKTMIDMNVVVGGRAI